MFASFNSVFVLVTFLVTPRGVQLAKICRRHGTASLIGQKI